MLTALSALLLATAPSADTRGLVLPLPIRFELVFETAKLACPKLEQNLEANGAQNTASFVSQLGERLGLNPDEQVSLINHCILYTRGRQGN